MQHQLRRDIAQVWRGRQGADLAAPGALQSAAEEQSVLRARHGDIEQAALLGVRAPSSGMSSGPEAEAPQENGTSPPPGSSTFRNFGRCSTPQSTSPLMLSSMS
jgi:hypothetical protein